MSGLFQRLAERAIGQSGRQFHAMAKLPFQRPASMLPEPPGAMETADRSTGPALAVETSLLQAQAQAPAASAPPQAPRLATPVSPGDLPAAYAPALSPLSSEQAARRPPADLPRHRPRARVEVEPPPAAAHAKALPGTRTTPEPQHSVSQAVAVTPAMREPDTAQAHSQARVAPPTERHPAQTSRPSAWPEPLLEQAESQSAPDHGSAPAPQHQGRSAADMPRHEPDEVHVHIGRVEIVAVQQTAASKRDNRKRPAPLSLEDYLERRKGATP